MNEFTWRFKMYVRSFQLWPFKCYTKWLRSFPIRLCIWRIVCMMKITKRPALLSSKKSSKEKSMAALAYISHLRKRLSSLFSSLFFKQISGNYNKSTCFDAMDIKYAVQYGSKYKTSAFNTRFPIQNTSSKKIEKSKEVVWFPAKNTVIRWRFPICRYSIYMPLDKRPFP